MKKSTNKYRRCPNCPHQPSVDIKCCCKKGTISTAKSRALTSRPKKEPSTIDNSSIMINSTIPTIIAEFSALRTENNHLKRQLLNVSTFLKDDGNQSMSVHHNEPTLSQKLFLSNKNLKEAIIEIDNLSKINKQLYQRNTSLSQQSEGLKIQLKELQTYCTKYKKRCKKYSQNIDEKVNKEQFQRMAKHNYQLEKENQSLKDQIRAIQYENHHFYRPETLSPQWVAHTNNKVNKPEPNMVKQESGPLYIDLQNYKKSISFTISTLKSQSTNFSTSIDHMLNTEVVSMQNLMQMLLQTYTETIFSHFNILIKQMNRKLNNYQKKLNNLISKIQNFVIIFKNRKLKKKIFPNIAFIKTQRIPMMDITNYQQ